MEILCKHYIPCSTTAGSEVPLVEFTILLLMLPFKLSLVFALGIISHFSPCM